VIHVESSISRSLDTTHVEELIGAIADRPCCHSNHVEECGESHPAPCDVMLTVHRWVHVGNVHLLVSLVLKILWTHVDPPADMNSAGDDDKPSTPPVQDI